MSGQSDQLSVHRHARGCSVESHRGTILGLLQSSLQTPVHALLSSPFFSDRALVDVDLMYVADCKGVTALVLGSIVSLLLADDRLGTSKEARLQLITTMLPECYDQHNGTHRLPPLRLTNVSSDGWDNLHGPAIKAANTRAAVHAFRGLCRRWVDRGTLSDNPVRFVIDALCLRNAVFVSDGGITRLHAASIQLGTEYKRLREFDRVADRRDWSRVINPKTIQNYHEQALISTVTNTWKPSIS